MAVNPKGAIYFARACMPAMVKVWRGVICCLGTVTGFGDDAPDACRCIAGPNHVMGCGQFSMQSQ